MSDRALTIAPTGIPGLIEFQATCGHPYNIGACPECVEHANRRQLTEALAFVASASVTPKARIGQTLLDESDLQLLMAKLNEYDAALDADLFGEHAG